MGARSLDETIVRLLRQATPSAQELFERRKKQVLEVCRRNGLRRLVALGSRVREDRSPGSDLDLVTTFPPRTTLLDVVRIQDELTEAFGCRVDLGSTPEPGTRLARHVQAEGVVLVGAPG